MKIVVITCLLIVECLLANCQTNTYYNGIQGIFAQNCIACHGQSGGAPFSLENLENILAHKGIIRSVVEKGIMPPWLPDADYTHFLGERILSASDRKRIIEWINQGCQAGVVPMPNSKTANKKEVAADLKLKLPFSIKIPASINDTTILVEMPYEIDRDTFISSFQFVPGQNSGIHHVFISLLNLEKVLAEDRPMDEAKGEFWDGKVIHTRAFYSDTSAIRGGWVPGQSAIAMPENVGWRLPKKIMLQYQIHYGPTPISFTSEFELWLTYSKSTVERIAIGQKYGSNTGRALPYPPLVIPPDSVMKFTLNGTIDFDCSIIAISPHMHLLGASVTAWLLKPTGDTTRLINIKQWDFNQQEFYYPPSLIKGEKGDLLQLEVVMDNTDNNVHNPNKPPKFVSYGPDTKNEMIQFSIYSVPYKKGDEISLLKKNN